jgi:hypothetical protein
MSDPVDLVLKRAKTIVQWAILLAGMNHELRRMRNLFGSMMALRTKLPVL